MAMVLYSKRFLRENPDIESKITWMKEHPPTETPMWCGDWPLNLIRHKGDFLGYMFCRLHPEPLKCIKEIGYDKIPLRRKLDACIKLFETVGALHDFGYVVGNMSPENIWYDPMTDDIIMTHSEGYQFTDGERVYRCSLMNSEYTAPEIFEELAETEERLGRKVSLKELKTGFTVQTDLFALAVHVFRLLEGGDPFRTRTREHRLFEDADDGEPEPPSRTENLMNGIYFHSKRYGEPRTDRSSDFDVYSDPQSPDYILDLFDRAFERNGPGVSRPAIREWIPALERFRNELRKCSHVRKDEYWKGLGTCPHCEMNYGVLPDIPGCRDTSDTYWPSYNENLLAYRWYTVSEERKKMGL